MSLTFLGCCCILFSLNMIVMSLISPWVMLNGSRVLVVYVCEILPYFVPNLLLNSLFVLSLDFLLVQLLLHLFFDFICCFLLCLPLFMDFFKIFPKTLIQKFVIKKSLNLKGGIVDVQVIMKSMKRKLSLKCRWNLCKILYLRRICGWQEEVHNNYNIINYDSCKPL